MGKREKAPASVEDAEKTTTGVQPPPGDGKEDEAAIAAAKAAADAKAARKEQNRLLRERFAKDPASLTPEERERAKALQHVLEKTQEAREAQKKGLETSTSKEGETDIESDKAKSKKDKQQEGKHCKGENRKQPLGDTEQKDPSEPALKKQKRKLGDTEQKDPSEPALNKQKRKLGDNGAEQKDSSEPALKTQKRKLGDKGSKQDCSGDTEGGKVPNVTGESEDVSETKWQEQAGPERILENQLLRARFLKGSKSLSEADQERAKILIARDERQKEKRQVRRDAKAAKVDMREQWKERRREHAIAMGRTATPSRGAAADKGRGKGKKGKSGAGKSRETGEVKSPGRGRGGGKSSGRGEQLKAKED